MSDVQGESQNEAKVRVSAGPLVAAVLTRVVGMLAARADWPLDRMDDALIVTDTIAAHGSKYMLDGHLTVDVFTAPDEMRLEVGSLESDGARRLHADAELPEVGNVLDRIASDVSFAPDPDSGSELLVVRLTRDGQRVR